MSCKAGITQVVLLSILLVLSLLSAAANGVILGNLYGDDVALVFQTQFGSGLNTSLAWLVMQIIYIVAFLIVRKVRPDSVLVWVLVDVTALAFLLVLGIGAMGVLEAVGYSRLTGCASVNWACAVGVAGDAFSWITWALLVGTLIFEITFVLVRFPGSASWKSSFVNLCRYSGASTRRSTGNPPGIIYTKPFGAIDAIEGGEHYQRHEPAQIPLLNSGPYQQEAPSAHNTVPGRQAYCQPLEDDTSNSQHMAHHRPCARGRCLPVPPVLHGPRAMSSSNASSLSMSTVSSAHASHGHRSRHDAEGEASTRTQHHSLDRPPATAHSAAYRVPPPPLAEHDMQATRPSGPIVRPFKPHPHPHGRNRG